jgi:hypothetical protein
MAQKPVLRGEVRFGGVAYSTSEVYTLILNKASFLEAYKKLIINIVHGADAPPWLAGQVAVALGLTPLEEQAPEAHVARDLDQGAPRGRQGEKFLHVALVGRRVSVWVDRSFLTTNSGYLIEYSRKISILG